jgi:iron complex outermembrane recepter protein
MIRPAQMKRALAFSIGIMALSATASTAVGAETADSSGASATDTGQIQEIVVTANKRSENLSKVGATIAAISSEDLQERKIESLADLASAIPGLNFAQTFTNTPIYTLRGVGFNESSIGVYPAVSIYIDQTPLPFPVLASHSSFDLERVEVLKGPQGTLFGENSTGGAVNYIAAKPTSTYQAGGDVSFGRFNEVDANVYVSGPISEQLLGRIALNAVSSSDWQQSYTRRDTIGKQNYIAGRMILDFHPADTVKLSLNLNGWNDTSDPQALALVAVRTQTPAYANPLLVNYPFPGTSNPRLADWTSGLSPTGVNGASYRPYSDRWFWQGSLRADIDLPNDLTLTSITSNDAFWQGQTVDYDGMALDSEDLQKNDGWVRSFNQEVRLANSAKSDLRWIFGGNYEHSETYEDQRDRYGDNSTSNPGTNFIDDSGVTNLQHINNWAVFGNADYKVVPDVTLKAGARYTKSKIEDWNCGYSPAEGDNRVGELFNTLGGLLGKVPFTPIGPGGCYTLNYNLVPGQVYNSTLAENNVSWRGGIDYQVLPDVLLYANASRGYKAGSYPTLAAAGWTALAPVKQEELTAYELGFKSNLLDRSLAVSGAVFDYDYANKQIRGKLLDPIFGVLDTLVNIPKSKIYGAEGEVTVIPAQGLRLTGAVTYLKSKVDQYSGYDVQGLIENFAGDRLPYTPEWSGLIDGEYKMSRPGGATPFVGVSVNVRSGTDATFGGDKLILPANPTTRVEPGVTYPYEMPGYATVDARLGYESQDNRWKVEFWGKNVLNKYYVVSVITGSDAVSRLLGRPATYGVMFSYKYQ